MAIEDIDVDQLTSALQSCLSKLDYSKTDSAISGLTDSIWKGKSKKNLVDSLKTLKDDKYKKLKDQINLYLNNVYLISDYQYYENQLDSLENQRNVKQNELNRERNKADKDQNKINRLQNEINYLNSQINDVNDKISSTESSINNVF